MPSPIGHALGALAVGWGIAGLPAGRRAVWIQGIILAALGIAPDLDLLVGRHRAETHSVGAAMIAGGLAAAGRWPLARATWTIAAAGGAAWGSHVVLDFFGADSSPPVGEMAAWPLSDAYVHGANLFPSVNRRWWLPGFVRANLWAVLFELGTLGPVAWAVWRWRRRAAPSEGDEETRNGVGTEQLREPTENDRAGTEHLPTPRFGRHPDDEPSVGRPRRGDGSRERGARRKPPREVDLGG